MPDSKELWQVARELLGEAELSRRFRLWISTLIRNARIKKKELTSDDAFAADVKAILDDLNARTGARHTATDKARHLIRGRMKEGYLLADFLKVNEVKCVKWLSDELMKDYLRPSTLYIPSHFDEYLAEWYALKRQRDDLAAKRAQTKAKMRPTGSPAPGPEPNPSIPAAERAAVIAELNSRPWHSFASWEEFCRWTLRFPDKESLAAYPMPQRIRHMRSIPHMTIKVIQNQSPAWAEEEYAALKSALPELDNG